MKGKKLLASIFLTVVLGVVFTPVSFALAQATTAGTSAAFENTDYEKRLGGCTDFNNINITDCLLRGYYYMVLYPSFWFAYLTGSVFDYFIAYSIDTASYSGANNTFVERGWSVIRDIANITFIFILLYVAIMHILNAASGQTLKLLKNIIIAALLINFSLFFTKVIIDAGNILARAFYNNIQVVNDNNIDHKTLSMGLVEHINPQTLLTSEFFTPRAAPPETDANGGQIILNQQQGSTASTTPGWMFLVMFMSTIVNVVVGLTFLSVFLLFAARVIGLWFMMIFSPIAFLSISFPNKSILGRMSITNWLKDTVSLSLMAPVFLFFLFLTIMFLDIAFTTSTPFGDQSSIQKFMAVVVPFIAIIILLNMAKKQAKDLSGEVGKQFSSTVGKAAGLTIGGAGLALGGAGWLARNTVGNAATRIARSGAIRRGVNSNNKLISAASKFTRAASQVAARSSFDARTNTVFKRTSSLLNQAAGEATGGKISTKVFGLEGMKGAGKGGYRQWERDSRRKEMNKELKMATDNDMRENESDFLNENRAFYNANRKRFDELERISRTRALSESEREEYLRLEQIIPKYRQIVEEMKNINTARRNSTANFMDSLGWWSTQTTDAVRRGQMPKDDDDDIKEYKKWKKEQEDKNNKTESEEGDEEQETSSSGSATGSPQDNQR